MSILDKDRKRLWVYNAGIDSNWQKENHGVKKINDRLEQVMYNCQAELVMFLLGENDIMLTTKQSDEEFLDDMKKFGFSCAHTKLIPNENLPISRILVNHSEILEEIKKEVDSDAIYTPYILSIYDELAAKSLNIGLSVSSANVTKQINNKVNARRIVEELGLKVIDGFICSSQNDLIKSYQLLKEKGYTKFAIKEPYNSAGKGVYFIKSEKQFQAFAKMLKFPDNDEFEVIIEGWIDQKRDINYQIEIFEDGCIQLLGITEQIISVTSYKGTIYPVDLTKEELIRYQEYSETIGKRLYELGYTGIVGIDSLILDQNVIIPSIEFNARLNQSTFFYPIVRKFEQLGLRCLIRSYDVQTTFELSYGGLKKHLKEKGLYYENETHTGILLINSTCLSCYQNQSNGMYHSRVFLAGIFENDVDTSYQRMDEFVRSLQFITMEG
jgi:Biotin carboxylase